MCVIIKLYTRVYAYVGAYIFPTSSTISLLLVYKGSREMYVILKSNVTARACRQTGDAKLESVEWERKRSAGETYILYI